MQERADEPHKNQDLGGFLCWLLPRRGFRIHLASFKYEGVERLVSKGRIQWGVDIIASKTEGGKERPYLFVLKHGSIGGAQWVPSEEGTMPHDLVLAVGRHTSDDSRHILSGEMDWEERNVVAVHNGDVDTEAIGAQVETFRRNLEQFSGGRVKTDWWNAERLVELALQQPVDGVGESIETRADATILPPIVQPFARLALDSLQRDNGGRVFDFDAVDRLVEIWLPLGRMYAADQKPGSKLPNGEAISAGALYRTLSEMLLFAAMLEVECRRVARGNTLPVLESLIRIATRTMEHLRRISGTTLKNERKRIREALSLLQDQYEAQATTLLERLESTRGARTENSLSIVVPGERVSFPIRALRLCGHVAVAGLVKRFRGNASESDALARRLFDLTQSNAGGFHSPVTDDQVIEVGFIIELLLRSDLLEEAAATAHLIADRFRLRKAEQLPLPSAWQRASWPLRDEDSRTLVAAYTTGKGTAPRFEDGASTLLALVLYVADQLGKPAHHEFGEPPHVQSWQPPEDAHEDWYAHELRRQGTVNMYLGIRDLAAFVAEFQKSAAPISRSPADSWEVTGLDRMAWMLWRNPAPMELFVNLVRGTKDRARKV